MQGTRGVAQAARRDDQTLIRQQVLVLEMTHAVLGAPSLAAGHSYDWLARWKAVDPPLIPQNILSMNPHFPIPPHFVAS